MSIIMSKALLKTKPRSNSRQRFPFFPPKKSVNPPVLVSVDEAPVLVSVDRAGDLKFGKRKCRLHKKEEVVKVAKKYGVPNAEKKTVQQLCGSIKAKAKASNDGMNNVPLAKLYPEAAKKQVAAKKRAEKKVFDRKVATNFLKTMVTNRVVTPARKVIVAVMPMPKPSKKAMPLTKEEANKRIGAMKGLSYENRNKLQRMVLNQHSPRRVVRVARELARLR
jgi:hypothetical protein